MALEEEIDRLSREKAALAADLWRFRQQQSGTRIQLEDLERRLEEMERRQGKMLAFLDRALRNPKFVQNLIQMAGGGDGSDLSLLHKKRRCCFGIEGNEIFNQDFSDKLKLGLCSSGAVSDGEKVDGDNVVVVAVSERSSSGGGGDDNEDGRLEIAETDTTLCPTKKGSLFADDGDELISCHLNLTLASSPMQIDKNVSVSRNQNALAEEAVGDTEDRDGGGAAKKGNSPPQEAAPPVVAAAGGSGRVNDVFWEQFLTERPGSSDTEEASSSLRTEEPSDDQQELTL